MAVGYSEPIICELNAASIDDILLIDRQVARVPWNRRMYQRELSNPCGIIFGARVRGSLVAFLACHAVKDEAHVLNLAVAKRWQRRGVGRALLNGSLVNLFYRGVVYASLEVRVSNLRARRLYESLGFSERGRRSAYYSDNLEDALVLGLNLEELLGDSTPFQSDTSAKYASG